MRTLKIYSETEGLKPYKGHNFTDAGLDLKAKEDITIPPHATVKVPTGVTAVIPQDTFLYITGRSSLNAKGIMTLQGVVDEQYRGELLVVLHNLTDEPFEIKKWDRIAQAVHLNTAGFYISFKTGKAPVNTRRGEKGFGSSNQKGSDTL